MVNDHSTEFGMAIPQTYQFVVFSTGSSERTNLDIV